MKRKFSAHIRRISARGIFFAVFLLPVVFLVLRSLSGIWSFPALLPESLNWRGVEFLVSNFNSIGRSLASTFVYSLATIFVTFVLSVAPAKVLARYEFKAKVLIESVLLAPLLLPAIVLTLSMYPVLFTLRLTENAVGVVLILSFATFPYMLRALVAGFESYGQGLETSAKMLGAGSLRRLYTVHIPQLLPAILSGSMVVFLSAFTDYFIVQLLGGGIVQSFSAYLFPLIRSGALREGAILSLIFLIIPILAYYLLDKFLHMYYNRRGLQIGGST